MKTIEQQTDFKRNYNQVYEEFKFEHRRLKVEDRHVQIGVKKMVEMLQQRKTNQASQKQIQTSTHP